MKKLLIITSFVSFSVYSGCDNCLHCNEGVGSTARYAVINSLEVNLLVEIHGNNQLTNLWVYPNDTTRSWEIVTPVAQLESKFFTLDRFDQGKSFPYNSDSILIKFQNVVLNKFYATDDYQTEGWSTSIYNPNNYSMSPSPDSSTDNIYFFYYSLDSVNLDLK